MSYELLEKPYGYKTSPASVVVAPYVDTALIKELA